MCQVWLLKCQDAHESVQFELLRNDASLGWLFGEHKKIPQCPTLWILHEVAHGLCDAKLSSESVSHPLPEFTAKRLAWGHWHPKCKWGNQAISTSWARLSRFWSPSADLCRNALFEFGFRAPCPHAMVSCDLHEFITRPVPTGHVLCGRHRTEIGSSIVEVFTHVRTPAEEPPMAGTRSRGNRQRTLRAARRIFNMTLAM